MWAADQRPVIALTLRYDRIDNFWFCLLHELAHVALHMDAENAVFIDDQSLRPGVGGGPDSKETRADELAEDSLIPRDAWESGPIRVNPTTMGVIDFAHSVGVHPAVVAGRVRYERGNHRLLSQLVGSGQARPQFERKGS